MSFSIGNTAAQQQVFYDRNANYQVAPPAVGLVDTQNYQASTSAAPPSYGFTPSAPVWEHAPVMSGPYAPTNTGIYPAQPQPMGVWGGMVNQVRRYLPPWMTGGGGVQPPTNNVPPGPIRPPSVDFRDLNNNQRESLTGLSIEELGTLHSAGRGLAFTGSREGIYQSYWSNLDKIVKGEKISDRDKAAVLSAYQVERQYGLPSGTVFEQRYLQILDKLTGTQQFSQMGQGMPPVRDTGKRLQVPETYETGSQEFINFQRSQGNTNADLSTLMLLTAWNHDPLDNGQIDGSIHFTELAAYESGAALVDTPAGKQWSQLLAFSELADGKVNNSSSRYFAQAFASAYTGGRVAKVTEGQIVNDIYREGAANGKTIRTIAQDVGRTVAQFGKIGLQNIHRGVQAYTQEVAQNPGAVIGTALGSMAAGVCPYLAGLSAAGGAGQAVANYSAVR
jgi:hypothetical protein